MAWKSRKKDLDIAEQQAAKVAQELYIKNVDLAHTNRTLSLLRIIDGLVLNQDTTTSDLLEGITKALIDNSSYLFSIVFIDKSNTGSRYLKAGSASYDQESWSRKISLDIDNTRLEIQKEWYESREISKVFDIEQPSGVSLSALFGEQSLPILNSLFANSSAKTVYIVKIFAQNKVIGLLFIGMNEPAKSVKLEELEQLGRIGEATGIALDNKLLTEQYSSLLKSLQRSNDKLKALDEAKDEFVSMASHQLRTPLTSIKGYVSMVLEGDAGKINESQRQMLGQALFSSQRMVYLISDLLNVSRLKTGKFIIESKPVYLPELVESELNQLVEGANAKNIALSFEKPKKFTMMNLDDMKLRQVVMNFTDNAIYYTPNGGKITLTLKDKKDSVEFTVRDTGMGVPKNEQHKLFAKFYRADNARKARPDGTGLGLFMAKKVIIAQGGSILFCSKEGKGSTFGFTFPKDKLEVK